MPLHLFFLDMSLLPFFSVSSPFPVKEAEASWEKPSGASSRFLSEGGSPWTEPSHREEAWKYLCRLERRGRHFQLCLRRLEPLRASEVRQSEEEEGSDAVYFSGHYTVVSLLSLTFWPSLRIWTASFPVADHKVFKMPKIIQFLHLIKRHGCVWPVERDLIF